MKGKGREQFCLRNYEPGFATVSTCHVDRVGLSNVHSAHVHVRSTTLEAPTTRQT